MKKIYLIFDYLKEAFHINRGTKALYKPQMILIFINLLLMAAVGVELYMWSGKPDFLKLVTGKIEITKILSGAASVGFGLIALVVISVILARVVEAGLYNMYKKRVVNGAVTVEDFWEGVGKFFFKFFLGDLVIFIIYVACTPFYFLAGILTLTVGLTVIPMVLAVFLGMWKVSLVMNDSTTFTAIRDSIKFAKRNFLPLSVIHLISWSFGNGFGFRGNVGDQIIKFRENRPPPHEYGKLPGVTEQDIEKIIHLGRIALTVIIPVVVVAVAVAALIKMIFEVFFTLVLFVTYKNGFLTGDEYMDEEVLE